MDDPFLFLLYYRIDGTKEPFISGPFGPLTTARCAEILIDKDFCVQVFAKFELIELARSRSDGKTELLESQIKIEAIRILTRLGISWKKSDE